MRGRFAGPHHQGPPPHRREHDDRDQGRPMGGNRHRDSAFEILEPQRSRGGSGMTGMRGGGRGGYHDSRSSLKSYDDFNVAPRGYHEKDDLMEHENRQPAPERRYGGGFYERERNEQPYHQIIQEDRMGRQSYYDQPVSNYYQYNQRDEPHHMQGSRGRGGPRGGGADYGYYRYGQRFHNEDYYGGYRDMAPPRRYNDPEPGAFRGGRGRDTRFGDQGESRFDNESDRPMN